MGKAESSHDPTGGQPQSHPKTHDPDVEVSIPHADGIFEDSKYPHLY